ncbi:serine hydrolase [Flagellimonas sp. CMM7]|uniref:serine hydrolase domain-containing protein n=1 Tax=Flagellimonas sp. CMM7 TaxID=2654676 RepID=UPI0013D551DD|nr:serine hydrolase domain-containing protein [Flagellimonas sp. CMM7]UII80648.1 beta-lactamase family protein [Flagellimonas sp. CMM7]
MKMQKLTSRANPVFALLFLTQKESLPKKFLILFFLSTSTIGLSQLSKIEQQPIDSIFSEWNELNKPGVAAGLIYGKNIQYLKGFGTANLESKRAIDPQTKFQVGHLSRQFTVLSVLLLEKMGKLSFSDSVQKYIPELPNYKHQLKIEHLLNHSSGLNDYEVIKTLLGKEEDDVFSHVDALHLISSQKQLNFVPGTQFSYMLSKTEITLLAEIIEKVSGESLTAFTKQNLFLPLKMNNTLFNEDHNASIPNMAYSYQADGEGFKNKALNLSNAGPTNLYTTAEDLLNWYKKFTTSTKSELIELIQQLDKPVTLKDGTTFKSFWGQMTLGRSFFHLERGLPAYWQYGLIGGYATNVFRFPEQRLTSFVLGNNDSYNGMPAMLMANHFIENEYPEPSTIDVSKIKSQRLTVAKLKEYEGYYWNADRALARRFYVEGDTLRYARLGQEQGLSTIPLLKEGAFQLKVESDDIITFSFTKENGQTVYDIASGIGTPYRYKKYQPISYDQRTLGQFTGSFYNKELHSIYTFSIQNDTLVVKGPENQRIEFFPVIKDVFRSNTLQFGSIVFTRNEEGFINKFYITTDGIRRLFFTKIID